MSLSEGRSLCARGCQGPKGYQHDDERILAELICGFML